MLDYLSSDYCLDNFSNLVVNQALRDTTTVVPGIQSLLMRYLISDYDNLEGLFGQLLINVAWIKEVEKAMYGTIHGQLMDKLQGPMLYDLAVINLL